MDHKDAHGKDHKSTESSSAAARKTAHELETFKTPWWQSSDSCTYNVTTPEEYAECMASKHAKETYTPDQTFRKIRTSMSEERQQAQQEGEPSAGTTSAAQKKE